MAINFPRVFANLTQLLLSYIDDNFQAINTQLGDKGGANGIASLDGSGKVVQDPATLGLASGCAQLDSSSRLTQPAQRFYTPDGVSGSAVLKTQRYAIGVWNMYYGGGGSGSQTAVVPHVVPDYTKIVSIVGVIYDDATVQVYPFFANTGVTVESVDNANVSLRHGGAYNSNLFNDTVMNRGYIFITYME